MLYEGIPQSQSWNSSKQLEFGKEEVLRKLVSTHINKYIPASSLVHRKGGMKKEERGNNYFCQVAIRALITCDVTRTVVTVELYTIYIITSAK